MDISLQFGDVIINPTVLNGFLMVIVLSVVFIIAGNQVKKADPSKPSKGLVLFLEILVTGINSLVKAAMGDHNLNFAPFIGTLVVFIATANLLGLIGFLPPTSDFNVTVALALLTVFMMWRQGFKSEGVLNTFKGTIFGDFPALAPLNIIGELAKPVSLSVRLFGNIMSGGIILGLVYSALGLLSPLVAPLLHIYFDVFSGLVQTLIFIMLTMIWTEGMTSEKETE